MLRMADSTRRIRRRPRIKCQRRMLGRRRTAAVARNRKPAVTPSNMGVADMAGSPAVVMAAAMAAISGALGAPEMR